MMITAMGAKFRALPTPLSSACPLAALKWIAVHQGKWWLA
jgi:hypothetical protein